MIRSGISTLVFLLLLGALVLVPGSTVPLLSHPLYAQESNQPVEPSPNLEPDPSLSPEEQNLNRPRMQPQNLPLRPLSHLHRLTVKGSALGPVRVRAGEDVPIRWELHDVPEAVGIRIRVFNSSPSPAPACDTSDPERTFNLGFREGNPDGEFIWTAPSDLDSGDFPSPEFHVRGCLYGADNELLGESTNVVSILLLQLTDQQNTLWIKGETDRATVTHGVSWPFRWRLLDPSTSDEARGIYLQVFAENPSGRSCAFSRAANYREGIRGESERSSFPSYRTGETVYVRACPAEGPDGSDAGPPSNVVELRVVPSFADLVLRPREFVLEPVKTGAEMVTEHHGRDGFACGINRGGLASKYWMIFDHPVGYTNWKSGGRPRCQWGLSRTFVTRFQFDLSDLPPVSSLESARLELTNVSNDIVVDPTDWEHGNRCGGSEHPRTNAVRAVVLNSRSWEEGKVVTSRHQFLTDGSRPWDAIYFDREESIDEVDLTQWVSWWQEGRFGNHGITFVGRRFDYSRENSVCIQNIHAPSQRLRLTYSPSIPWLFPRD